MAKPMSLKQVLGAGHEEPSMRPTHIYNGAKLSGARCWGHLRAWALINF
jgi:hypothetical protein